MRSPKWLLFIPITLMILWFVACTPNQQPVGLTPIPSMAPRATETLMPALEAQGNIQNVVSGPRKGEAGLGVPIYMKYCSECHGNNGQGINGPELRGDKFIQESTDSALFTKIAIGDHKNDQVMPGWLQNKGGELTPEDINNVMAYLRTLEIQSVLPTATPIPPPPTETPLPPDAPTAEPAEAAAPSNPGDHGPAVQLTGNLSNGKILFGHYCTACHGPEGIVPVPNPGTNDQVIPQLYPLDETIQDADLKAFTNKVDVFIEHGSTPAGDAPQINMPAFGDEKYLTPQQIADIITYVISLNPVQPTETAQPDQATPAAQPDQATATATPAQ